MTLISGPTNLDPPENIEIIKVNTAKEMYQAVIKHSKKSRIVVMSAAVSDYRPSHSFTKKIPKRKQSINLELTRTVDILSELGKNKNGTYLVGFAAESENLTAGAKEKLKKTKLDVIVANNTSAFSEDDSEVHRVSRDGQIESLPYQNKILSAHKILDKIVEKKRCPSADQRK